MKTEKYERFVKLADGRVNYALEYIRKIGNLANRVNYDYEKADVERIFEALRKEIDDCEKLFEFALKSDDKAKFSVRGNPNTYDF